MNETRSRTTGSVSDRRSDTRRNHERILAVAAESLRESDNVSFNAIAKRAEVGVGTVYRHFRTPEVLILAVYEREVQRLVEVVSDLLGAHSPEQAFRSWVIDHLAWYMMTKRGLANALNVATSARGAFPAETYAAILSAVETLLAANIDAGNVRPDLSPATVLRGLAGLLLLDPHGEWRHDAESLADLVWSGMGKHPGGHSGRD